MKATLDHSVEASVYLWLDNLLIEQNEGFSTYSGSLRPTPSMISGFTSYSAPHRQFVYDSSVPNAVVPNALTINGAVTPVSPTVKIDFYRGQGLLTSSSNSIVSARYSFKEINIYYVTSSEHKVLFENTFSLNPRSSPKQENFNAKDLVYPCIFIKSSAGENTTLCFDGCASTVIQMRLIFLAENFYQYRAVTSALRDAKETFLPIFNPSELPFDQFNSLKSGSFDYSAAASTIQADSNRLAYIKDVAISDFNDSVNSKIAPKVFGGFIDLDIEILRFPHS